MKRREQQQLLRSELAAAAREQTRLQNELGAAGGQVEELKREARWHMSQRRHVEEQLRRVEEQSGWLRGHSGRRRAPAAIAAKQREIEQLTGVIGTVQAELGPVELKVREQHRELVTARAAANEAATGRLAAEQALASVHRQVEAAETAEAAGRRAVAAEVGELRAYLADAAARLESALAEGELWRRRGESAEIEVAELRHVISETGAQAGLAVDAAVDDSNAWREAAEAAELQQAQHGARLGRQAQEALARIHGDLASEMSEQQRVYLLSMQDLSDHTGAELFELRAVVAELTAQLAAVTDDRDAIWAETGISAQTTAAAGAELREEVAALTAQLAAATAECDSMADEAASTTGSARAAAAEAERRAMAATERLEREGRQALAMAEREAAGWQQRRDATAEMAVGMVLRGRQQRKVVRRWREWAVRCGRHRRLLQMWGGQQLAVAFGRWRRWTVSEQTSALQQAEAMAVQSLVLAEARAAAAEAMSAELEAELRALTGMVEELRLLPATIEAHENRLAQRALAVAFSVMAGHAAHWRQLRLRVYRHHQRRTGGQLRQV